MSVDGAKEGPAIKNGAPAPGPRQNDLSWDAMIPGQKPTAGTIQIARHRTATRRPGPGLMVLRPEVHDPSSGLGRLFFKTKHFLIGSPLASAAAPHERLTKIKALAIFSSDALSSVAYATEEIMKVLVLVGVGVLYLTLPISGVIVLLLAIVVLSYRQTIRAYPSGGGSYIVASDNLGLD